MLMREYITVWFTFLAIGCGGIALGIFLGMVAAGVNFIYSTVKATVIEEIIAPSSAVQRPFEDRERLNKRRASQNREHGQ